MKSEDSKRIIKEIATEEGLSKETVEAVIMSQFKGVVDVIRSGIPDKPETFKSIRLNALCHFKVMDKAFDTFKGHDKYLEEKERRKKLKYGNKK
jgi:hypothetical protein